MLLNIPGIGKQTGCLLTAHAAATALFGTSDILEPEDSESSDLSGFLTGTMTKKPSVPKKGTTTMYVSSALCGRHGLCILLENVDQAGTRRFGMVDTGNAGSAAMKSFLQDHGVRSLEFLILTHMHGDHIGNAVYLLNNYQVKALYLKQFDGYWSDGEQAAYEKILRAAISSASVNKIVGVSYALSMSAPASPSATSGFISWLKSHAGSKTKFKGLFTESNVSFSLGNSKIQLFNWEIWSRDGISRWQPGKTLRCRAAAFSRWNSDNNFSLGVRVAQGSSRLWIGGDMNNLRLIRKAGCPYKGDEDRLRASIGPVDAMVMNHHGRSGSNTTSFLSRLSPQYVVYTSLRSEIENGAYIDSLASFRYLKSSLHLSEDHILWAGDYWKTHPEDPVITVSSAKLLSSVKDGTDMETWKGAGGANCTAVPLKPGHTYTTYDLTGDGKADFVQILSPVSSGTRSGLTIRINQQAVYSTKRAFTDVQPVTLVLQPGHRTFLCVSILSPKDGNGQFLKLFQYRNVTGVPLLYTVYDILQNIPDKTFQISKTPSFKVTSDLICLTVTGSDALGKRISKGKDTSLTNPGDPASVTFRLIPNGTGLEPASGSFPYTIGKSGRICFGTDLPLYGSLNAVSPTQSLPAGTIVTVTHVCENKAGTLRYRIMTSDSQIWWME